MYKWNDNNAADKRRIFLMLQDVMRQLQSSFMKMLFVLSVFVAEKFAYL